MEVLVFSSIRLLGLALGFASSIVLARAGSAELLGVYVLIFSVVNIAAVVCNLGLNNVIVREFSIGRSSEGFVTPTSVLSRLNLYKSLALLVGVPIALVFLLNTGFGSETGLSLPLLFVAIVLIVLFSIITDSYASALLACGARFVSQLITFVIKPALTLLAAIYVCYGDVEQQLKVLLLAILAANFIVLALAWLLGNNRVRQLRGTARLDSKVMLQAGYTLLGAQVVFALFANLGALLVGWVEGAEAAGAYHVCVRLAAIANIALLMANTVKAPEYARLFNQGKIPELETLVKKTSSNITYITLLFVIPMALLGKYVLGIWGEYYVAFYACLLVLLLAYLVDGVFGTSGKVLVMVGQEARFFKIAVTVGFVGVAYSVLLVTLYGVMGAALSFLGWIIMLNISWAREMTKKLGFFASPGAFSGLR